jgi:sugar lactone lactonase YvrE
MSDFNKNTLPEEGQPIGKKKEVIETDIMPDVVAVSALGQSEFISCMSNRGTKAPQNNSLNEPWGIWGEKDRVFVTDSTNNRLLIWNSVGNDRPADLVLGQASFNDGRENRWREKILIKELYIVGSEDWREGREVVKSDADTLSGPTGIFAAGGRLFVADTDNHRILIWNKIPSDNGKAADLVIGQPDFVSWSANRDGNLGAGSLFFPVGVFSDGVRLFVADKDNHRVLIWNRIPETNGKEADIVLGQPDFKSRMINAGNLDKAGPDTFSFPTNIFYDGSYLFVTDQGNNRILIWDHIPQRNGEPANMVLGQKDLTGRAPNRSGACSACSLKFPGHVFCRGGDLYIVDQGNNRVLVWRDYSWKEKESADLVIGQPNFEESWHHWKLVKVEEKPDEPSIEGESPSTEGSLEAGETSETKAYIRLDTTNCPNSFTLWDPSMVWVDDRNRIFILDRGNNRVIIWNEMPTKGIEVVKESEERSEVERV